MKYIFKIITAVGLALFATNAFADQNYFKEKSYNFSAIASKEKYVELSNQYGDVEIFNSESDSIKIQIQVKVNSKSEVDADLQGMLDRINISFRSSDSYVIAETQWDGKANFFNKTYQTIKSGFDAESENIEINYKVYLPQTMELTIKNKFGNVYMDNHTGRIDIKIMYGELRARDLTDIRKIEIKYGKLKLNSVKNGTFYLVAIKYAEIESANEITINSASSDIEIRKVKSFDLRSKHDKISIGSIDDLAANLILSDLKVKNLDKSINSYSKFGSIRIGTCNILASDIQIELSRADLNLGFQTGFKSIIEVDITELKFLTFDPKFMKDPDDVVFEDSIKTILTIGKGATIKTRIKSHKGYVSLNI